MKNPQKSIAVSPAAYDTMSNEMNGSSLATSMHRLPYFAKNSSIEASAPFVHILSTTSLPSIRAIQKQSAAPAIEDAHERIHPCHHPNRLALVNVMKNAGNGAAIDWKIISKADIAIAHLPYLLMNSRISSKLPVRNISSTLLTHTCTAGIAKYAATSRAAMISSIIFPVQLPFFSSGAACLLE